MADSLFVYIQALCSGPPRRRIRGACSPQCRAHESHSSGTGTCEL